MAFSVRIDFVGGGTTTLAINPVYSASFAEERGENAEPAPVIQVIETWTLTSRVHSATTAADWTTLRNLLVSTALPVSLVVVLRDAVNYHVLGAPTHEQVAVELVESDGAAPGAFGSNVPYTIRVRARRPPSTARVVRARLSFSYDDAGLSTRTWEGEVATPSGTSAEAQARVLGTLALPGATWGYETAGPEGLDVERLDGDRNTRAAWKSVAREHGLALPAGVNSYHVEEETIEQPGGGALIGVTRTTVEAAGGGALAAVRALRPDGANFVRVVDDQTGRRARAEYTREAAGGNDAAREDETIERRFVVRGGGVPISDFPISGGHDPVLQFGARSAFQITEDVTVTRNDVDDLADVPIPDPPAALVDFQDGAEREELVPVRDGVGADAAADRWVRTVHRAYKLVTFDALAQLFDEVLEAANKARAQEQRFGAAGPFGVVAGFGNIAEGRL